MALHLTDDNFSAEVVDSGKLAMVDFWAAWCGPCKMLAPFVEELAEDFKDNVVIGKLDVDHNPKVSEEFLIRSLPTILFFKDGKVVDRHVGLTTKDKLKKKIEAHL